MTFAGDGRMYTTHNFMALRRRRAAAAATAPRHRRRPPPRADPDHLAADHGRPAAHHHDHRTAAAAGAHRGARHRGPRAAAIARTALSTTRLSAMTRRRRDPRPDAVVPDSGVALDGLTLDVQQGEVLALLGPNGAGKTTTVRLLNGILRPDRGRALVLGLDPTVDPNGVRRRTGVLTEHAGLDERLTARENLVLTGRMRGPRPALAWSSRTDELLERFGMADRADLTVQGTSTGQRKRLALARALLHDPDVLFLDEPTSGLDPSATRDVIDLIGSLATEHGRTVVLCTHFLGEAGRLANRMAVLDRGVLHAFGRPEEIAADLWDGVDAAARARRADRPGHRRRRPRAAAACRWWRPRPTARSCGWTTARSCRTSCGCSWSAACTSTAPAPRRRRSRTSTSRSRRASRPAARHRSRRPVSEPAEVTPMSWTVMRAIIAKDVIAIRRSKAIVIPMLAVPALLMIVMPAVIGTASKSSSRSNIQQVLENIPGDFADPILALPAEEQLIVLVLGYLLAPLFLIVPLMVSAVLAADAFAGEKERKTLESLLHLPISDRELFYAKLLTAFIPAMVGVVGGVPVLQRGVERGGLAGAPPGLRAHPALARDDPLGGAGGRRARPGGDGAGVRPRAHEPGGQPARRRGDPPAHLPRRRPVQRPAPRPPRDRHRRRRPSSGSSPCCSIRGGAKRFTRDQLAAPRRRSPRRRPGTSGGLLAGSSQVGVAEPAPRATRAGASPRTLDSSPAARGTGVGAGGARTTPPERACASPRLDLDSRRPARPGQRGRRGGRADAQSMKKSWRAAAPRMSARRMARTRVVPGLIVRALVVRVTGARRARRRRTGATG